MNKKIWLPLAFIGGAMAVSAVPAINRVRIARLAHAQENADARAVQLLSQFLRALQSGNSSDVVPYLHRSLLSADGNDLDSSVRIQYKKASQNAKNYAVPAQVSRVRSKGTITIGEGANPEKGRVEDYFVNKNNGGSSPVTIFFPENGAPKIYYMGGL